MNKAELIEKVADNAQLTKKDAAKAVDEVFRAITCSLMDGDSVRLIGFGTFDVRSRKARTGRNPRVPGELINIPASKAPVFKAGRALKDALNK